MANAGDTVKIITSDNEYLGMLMPSLGLTGEDTYVLKLENGYNIGILKKDVNSIKVLKKYEPPKQTGAKMQTKKGLPTVSILSIGGTISSKVDYKTGGVYADYSAKDFVEMCPELLKIANIKAKKVMSLMSEDMLPKDWIAISKIIKSEAKGVRGIVLTQGTDTLHFTASALSFMLDANIPIVITASQRSIDRGSSDAFMNLICSVNAAAKFDGALVMSCMHATSNDDYCYLIRGTKVRKMDTSRRDAFRPINDLPLAKVFPDGRIDTLNHDYPKIQLNSSFAIDPVFDNNLALIYVYPGLDPEIIDFYLNRKVRAIVLAATALGHVNTWTEKSLIPKLEQCYNKKVPVFVTSQSLYGRVDPYVYSNLRRVSVTGHGIFLKDIMPETAYTKLGWVLAHCKTYSEIVNMMQTNFKGEFSKRLTPNMFLY